MPDLRAEKGRWEWGGGTVQEGVSDKGRKQGGRGAGAKCI